MRKRSDATAVVEAAYELHHPEPTWLGGLLRAAQPLLDEGEGLQGFAADLNAPAGRMLRSPVSIGGPPAWASRWRTDWWESLVLTLPDELLSAAITLAPVWYASMGAEAIAAKAPTLDLYIRELADRGYAWARRRDDPPPRSAAADEPLPFRDALNVQATDPTGHAIVLSANRTSLATRPPSRAMLSTWTRVASHIAAAFRARRKLGTRDALAGAEAVLAPGGKILHATGAAERPAARASLRQAAIDIDRARTTNVRGTDEALELWRALHQGRWSVLDTFDRDGRRFLVARENAPAADPAPSLSRREQQVLDLLALGHSNKVIAYDLGISISSVATHLRRAATKLGVDGTRDLIRWSRMRARPRDRA